MVEIKIDLEKCDGCGTCVDICPVEVFEVREEKLVVVNFNESLVCMAFKVRCPTSAIEVIE